ncbi:PP2C family protein-serine/threonine phosphatase [Mycolicibacterium sp. BiH015]|uniref:PP2C family protein-serine/threonine phosphatase n=1 Tax=Mycolicibacterium sp. BiH015 TaxID=3018808 RepID=UPI0022E64585|nr:PP2C family protein-serine/threonine phosphatase [Mycolicibacterium sp. BiH015]MDA2892056.1 PP2C family protein-serine/threonine phosphatase [Mycolicibacterium sp. BiH015]
MGKNTPLDVDSRTDADWESVPHPVLVVDRDGLVRTLSASARSMLAEIGPGSALNDFVPTWLSNQATRVAHQTPLPGGEVAWWLIDDPDHSARETRQALAMERERAAFLDEASAVLMASLNIDRCMEATVQMAARHIADAAVLVAPVSRGQIPVVSCGPAGEAQHCAVEADPADVAGLDEALRGFPPVPSRWIDPASVPEWLVPQDFVGEVGSVVVTPLPGHGVPAGALVLLRRTSETAFSDGEEIFARLFAARAGAALSAARLYAEQSAITRTLMRDLLPPQLHRLDGIELAGGYRASEDHEAVGGDFYDVHPAQTPDGETLVVLGDVCGKGLEAALLTGKIRNTLQALAPLAQDHGRVLKLLNSALISADSTRFATLVLASVSRRDGHVAVRLTSAGHLAPLIVRNDGRVEEVDTEGTLVGVMPETRARTVETTLYPGETCLLYTDGVTEARGGPLGNDMFGEDRLSRALSECTGMPAEAIVERVMMLTSQWVNRRSHDDIAVMAITAPRRTHLSAVDGHTAGRFTA